MKYGRGAFLAALAFVMGAGHILQGAKPAPVVPGLAISNKINIVTWDATNYLRVWEKAALGDSFKAAWKSTRVHEYWSIDLGNATNGTGGAKAIVATETSLLGADYNVRFVAYLDGSTGLPQYVSEYISGGANANRPFGHALVADVTTAYEGNEVVLMSDIALAVFHFENGGFAKKAETLFPGESAKFYDLCTADVDADLRDEIVISAHNEGQVWIYGMEGEALVLRTILGLTGDAQGSLMGDCVRAADIDADGDIDIMAYSTKWIDGAYQRYFNTWESVGSGYLHHSQPLPGPGSLFRFDAADLTGDGRAEVAIGGAYEVDVYLWAWSGISWNGPAYPIERHKFAGIAIRSLGGMTPKIVIAGAVPNIMTKAYYLETFAYPGSTLSSQWKFEGTYYKAVSIGID